MTDTRMRFFGNLHPAVSMAYFVLVLSLTLACMHPVAVVLSFLGASWFSIRLRGWRAYGHTMRFVGPMFLLIALANPLFNHRGVTMLFTINHLLRSGVRLLLVRGHYVVYLLSGGHDLG